jgi:hypothetical protein
MPFRGPSWITPKAHTGDKVLFKRLAVLLSLIFTLAFTTSAVAQDVPALDPSEVEGLENAYGRMYMVDIESVMSTPGAAEAVAAGETPLSGMAAVFSFDDAGNAEAAFDQFSDEFVSGFFGDAEVEETEVDDLGDKAIEYTGEMELDATETATTSMLIIQDGETLMISMIMGGTETSDQALGLAEYMLDAEPGEDEATVVDDGTSTGGTFDVMPTADDADVVGGMIPFMDIDFLEGGSF